MKINFKIEPINLEFIKNYIINNSDYTDRSDRFGSNPTLEKYEPIYVLDKFRSDLILICKNEIRIYDSYSVRKGKSIIINYKDSKILEKINRYLKNEN